MTEGIEKRIGSYTSLTSINGTEKLIVTRGDGYLYNLPVSLLATAASLAGKVDKDGNKVLSTHDFTSAFKAKLEGIASGATANAADAYLLARANHTGYQAISTITGLQAALDAKGSAATLNGHLIAVNPHGVTKGQVGLGNCDNTSDLNKPLSTAAVNALNLKMNSSFISVAGVQDGYVPVWDTDKFIAGIPIVPASEYVLKQGYTAVSIAQAGTGFSLRSNLEMNYTLNMSELYGCPLMVLPGQWLMQCTADIKFRPDFSDHISFHLLVNGLRVKNGAQILFTSGTDTQYFMTSMLLLQEGEWVDIEVETDDQTGAISLSEVEFTLSPVSRVTV